MNKFIRVRTYYLFLLIFCLPIICLFASVKSDTVITTLSDDGAWCWFQDPRAVFIEGKTKTIVSGWVTREGKLQVGSFNLESGNKKIVTLRENWGEDDHNTCSFLVLPDKRLMVFYAQHNKHGLYCRTSVMPENISQWEEEIVVCDGPRITYSHPVYLKNEGRFYVFWRGESWKPTFSTSADGKIWSVPQILIQEKGRSAKDIRPYIKITSDGKSTIHFAFTDGHPRNEPFNSIYYLKYQYGIFYRADDTIAGFLGRLPVAPSRSDLVYDGRKTKIRAWVWDIAIDDSGSPVIAYTRLPSETDHRYQYACWTGDTWLDTEITAAGRWFPQTPAGKKESEPHYSGGLSINPEQPDIIYLSRQIKNSFVIEKWVTADSGRHWQSQAITAPTGSLNVRPVVPRFCPPAFDIVLWMYGSYVHYTNFHTGIKLYILEK